MNIQQMMKQAQQMQERLQKQMAEMRVEASSGGGMVTVVVNGNKQIQSLKIDPEVVSQDDVEMLQDLILAAIGGKKMPVVSAQQDGPAEPPVPQAGAPVLKPVDLKAAAMSDAAVQAMLDVFPAEIEDVEEIK